MKTVIQTIAAIIVLMISASNPSFAGIEHNYHNKVISLPGVNRINKIEARGKIDLYIMYGDSDKVEVNDCYYQQNALVQVEKGILRITSYNNERIKVWVTVNDLRNLLAYDEVYIRSIGRLSTLDLTIELNDRVYAKLNIDCFTTDISLHGNSKADLEGFATKSNLLVNYSATANTNIIADTFNHKRIAAAERIFVRFLASNELVPETIKF
ncbi:GIN domain-containing protein [Mucilaginibacter phyllosphaerae]